VADPVQFVSDVALPVFGLLVGLQASFLVHKTSEEIGGVVGGILGSSSIFLALMGFASLFPLGQYYGLLSHVQADIFERTAWILGSLFIGTVVYFSDRKLVSVLGKVGKPTKK
jgi:hypothetical protein